MGRNIIVSEDTLRDLLEAHASLSAWYYELMAGLRAANGTAKSPDDATRSSFLNRIATDFPELAQVARAIGVPRNFVPPPPAAAPPGFVDSEDPTLMEPAPARMREAAAQAPPEPPPPSTPAPPAFVVPSTVKYDGNG